MRRSTLFPLLVVAGFLPMSSAPFLVASVRGEQDWRPELEAVCSQTDFAMSLSKEELGELIRRCENLKLRIESEEATVKKVFLRRLMTCRDLFGYILESKNKDPDSDNSSLRPREKGD